MSFMGRPPRHGLTGTKVHRAWTSMRERCTNPNYPRWEDYGGRGIKICPEWEIFENFLESMGTPAAGMTLDRIDNDGNYEPGNCRWATRSEQQLNRRNRRLITYKGKTQDLKVWAKELAIDFNILAKRFHRGWPVDRMLETPKLKQGF